MPRGVDVKVTFDQAFAGMVMVLGTPALTAAGEIVAEAQRKAIPVSNDGSYGREPGYARDRISVQVGVDALGPYLDVGSDATTPDGVSYPLILDVGSKPHDISSHGDYPLRDKHGHIFGRTVHHPGTRPTYWCRNSILALAGRTL